MWMLFPQWLLCWYFVLDLFISYFIIAIRNENNCPFNIFVELKTFLHAIKFLSHRNGCFKLLHLFQDPVSLPSLWRKGLKGSTFFSLSIAHLINVTFPVMLCYVDTLNNSKLPHVTFSYYIHTYFHTIHTYFHTIHTIHTYLHTYIHTVHTYIHSRYWEKQKILLTLFV